TLPNARTAYVALPAPTAVVVCALLCLRSRRLNPVALGADAATNLGLRHRRELMATLLLGSVLMAMCTALVGPVPVLRVLV
ncbi:iron chelate uptake ABC transporter family permease subunit, partial [Micrococcus sp. GbtcB5]|uniref:iron chelate uptake ABC transporter family permease subunit n=1 Tax=Micrococcus sp. GbtcB5 TaxID=2824750 RepID=UPI001C2F2709